MIFLGTDYKYSNSNILVPLFPILILQSLVDFHLKKNTTVIVFVFELYYNYLYFTILLSAVSAENRVNIISLLLVLLRLTVVIFQLCI